MSHYFEDTRHLKSNRKDFSFRFWCFNYSFVSDNGVFSKEELDEGTRILLETALENKLEGKVLDLGCGIGPVGVVVKHNFPNCEVEMVDVNPRALELAKENAKRNHVDTKIYLSDAFENIETRDFSAILVNPPIRAGKAVIYKMFDQSIQHLKENGCLWVVMRKSHGALSAKKKLEVIYGNCEIVNREKGFYILCSQKA